VRAFLSALCFAKSASEQSRPNAEEPKLNVPVVAVVPASKEDIKPGAIVFVPTIRQSDGSLTSGAVLFGKDGVIPPM